MERGSPRRSKRGWGKNAAPEGWGLILYIKLATNGYLEVSGCLLTVDSALGRLGRYLPKLLVHY